jgi:Phosphotransferase enzyme family
MPEFIPPSAAEVLRVCITVPALAGATAVLGRETLVAGTYPKEVVALGFRGGKTLKVFVKYFSGFPPGHHDEGARMGILYESRVYEKLLASLPISSAQLFGYRQDEETGLTWLLLEALENAAPIHLSENPDAAVNAATWLGAFHALASSSLKNNSLTWLELRALDHYRTWTAPTLGRYCCRAETAETAYAVADRLRAQLPALERASPTVVHGEYFPENILYARWKVYPVDWESAYVGAGELDLATLAEGWDDASVLTFRDAYVDARWRGKPPVSFEPAFDAARLVTHIRWLGPAALDARAFADRFTPVVSEVTT